MGQVEGGLFAGERGQAARYSLLQAEYVGGGAVAGEIMESACISQPLEKLAPGTWRGTASFGEELR